MEQQPSSDSSQVSPAVASASQEQQVPVAAEAEPAEAVTLVEVAAPAGADEQGDPDGLESLGQVVRDALPKGISLGSVPRSLRVVVGLALALLCLTAVLLVASTLPQPHLGVAGTGDGRIVQVPVAVVALVFIVLIFGGALALAGALRMPIGPRLFILAVATLILGFLPLGELQVAYSVARQSFDAAIVFETVARVGQLLLLVVLWLWAIGLPLLRRLRVRRLRGGPAADESASGWQLPTFLRALALVGVYYALEFAILVVYLVAGYSGVAYQTTSFVVSFQLENLPLLLGAVTYYAVKGLTDVDFSLVAVAAAISRLLWRPWLLMTWVAVAALAIGVDVLRSDGVVILTALPVALIFLALAWVLARASVAGARWPEKVPPAAVALGAAVLFFQLDVASLITAQLQSTHGLTHSAAVLIDDALAVGVGVLALAAGLLLARGSATSSARPIGFFLALVGLLSLALHLPALFTNARLVTLPSISLDSLRLLAAVLALGVLGWILTRPKTRERPAATLRLLTLTFLALVGLQALQWTITLLAGEDALQKLPLFAALLFLASLSWDLLSSGDVTDRSSSAPRDARVMVHFGAVLLGAATLLYTATRTYQGSGAPVDLAAVNRAAIGLIGLGVPLLLYGTARRVSALVQHQAQDAAVQVATSRLALTPWAARLAIVGASALAIGLVVTLTATALSALTVQPVNGPYSAAAPGPCDSGGARWSEPAQTHATCQSTGLVLQGPGYIDFQLQNGRWPHNYEVAVRVTFAGASDECAGIVLRANNDSGFEHSLCSDGSAQLLRTTGLPDLTPTGTAQVPLVAPLALVQGHDAAQGGMLQAVADGAQQRLLLDGQQLASAPDSPADATILVRLFAQTTDSTASVTLSDFTFTPLSDVAPGPAVDVTPTTVSTATVSPTPSATPSVTSTASASATAAPSATTTTSATPTPTPLPSATATVAATATATPAPTATPTPSPTPSPYQPYYTHTPGPKCDPGNATWFVGSGNSETCLPGTGWRYNLPAASSSQGVADDLLFTPPEKVFPQNYRVSAHFDVSALPKGCMALSLRATSSSGYYTIMCTDGSWVIEGGNLTPVSGTVSSLAWLSAYTVTAEANGTAISLTVNGSAIDTVNDNGPTTSHAVDLEVDNVNNQPASPVVSDFTYTPLP